MMFVEIFLYSFLVAITFNLITSVIMTYQWDQFARRLYESHREDWDECGRPQGFFFKPPELPDPGVTLSTERYNSLKKVIRLSSEDPGARCCPELVKEMRLLYWASFAFWLVGFASLFGLFALFVFSLGIA